MIIKNASSSRYTIFWADIFIFDAKEKNSFFLLNFLLLHKLKKQDDLISGHRQSLLFPANFMHFLFYYLRLNLPPIHRHIVIHCRCPLASASYLHMLSIAGPMLTLVEPNKIILAILIDQLQ